MIETIAEWTIVLLIFSLGAFLAFNMIKQLPNFFSQLPQKTYVFIQKPKNIISLIVALLAILVCIDMRRREEFISLSVSLLILIFLISWIRKWIKSNLKF